MKKLAVLTMLIISLFIISSCGPIRDGRIKDYYGEYTFVLPFDHTVSNKTDIVYFDADYSIEQMAELVNEAGYNASLHEIGNAKSISIFVPKNGFYYYFIVYDKSYFEIVVDYYILSDVSLGIRLDGDDVSSIDRGRNHPYVFLAPLHILGRSDSGIKRVYGSFEDIAEFYRATGKNDAEIDDVNRTVKFWCEGNPNFDWRQGTIIMQYTETATGNYLEISPFPVDY